MKLTVIHGPGEREGLRQEFQGDPIRIGRSQDSDILLSGETDRGVSSSHARIVVIDNAVTIEDLQSTNGTYLNGHRIYKEPISDGDVIRMGDQGPSITIVKAEKEDRPSPPAPKDFPLAPPDAAMPGNNQGDLGEKKYGQRTVGMMIKQALSQAGMVNRGTSKSTDYIKALVDHKVQSTSWNLRIAFLIAVGLLLIGGTTFGVYLYRNRSVQVIQTTQVNYGDAAGGSIAQKNRSSVFLLTGIPINGGKREGFCSAFAVNANVLATNAHCVQRAIQNFTQVLTHRNGTAGQPYSVVRMVAHPRYTIGTLSPDVGIIQIQGHLTEYAPIAGAQELAQLRVGDVVFLYGFPARLAHFDAPEATFVRGEIGRITDFAQRLAPFEQASLLQHSAFTSGGTSGSPMFNANGHVVGLNAGGYAEMDGRALTGYNFGMRIDLINSLFPFLNRK